MGVSGALTQKMGSLISKVAQPSTITTGLSLYKYDRISI